MMNGEEMRMAKLEMPDDICPRCGGPVPDEAHRGQYPGAVSRTTRDAGQEAVYVCSYCGLVEAMEQYFIGEPLPQEAWPAVNRWLADKAVESLKTNGF